MERMRRRLATGESPAPGRPPSQPQGFWFNMEDQETGRVITQSGSYRWDVKGFSRMVKDQYQSEAFTIAGCTWRILLFPRGNKMDRHLSLYLEVAEPERLPKGWSIDARVKLTIKHQYDPSLSITRVTPFHVFSAQEKNWGLRAFKSLVDVTNYSKGFLVSDTIIIVAEVAVYKVSLPRFAANFTEASKFDSYFTQLEQFVKLASDPVPSVEGSSSKRTCNFTLEAPSKEEVEKAKQSLRECLHGAFELDIKGKLYAALSTLRHAEGNLSSEQMTLVWSLFANFDDFVGGFITSEHDWSKLEIHKLRSGQFLSAMKKNSEIHVSYKELLEKLTLEEKMLEMRLKELRSNSTKLVSDWGALMSESEEVKSSYAAEQKKIVEAEEQIKKSEEGRARSATAWERMKDLFA